MKHNISKARAFTLLELLTVVAIVAILLTMLLAKLNWKQFTGRRDTCINNTKLILIALHNYHDAHRCFPNVSANSLHGVAPASQPSPHHPGASYSWQVTILPLMERLDLYTTISEASQGFKLAPFDPKVVGSPLRPAALQPEIFLCPSVTGQPFATAPEYRALGKAAVARSSYVPLAATHLESILGDPTQPDHIPPNGVIIPGPAKVNFRDVSDGVSHTLALTETREQRYTSWYDGTVGWVVGADPNGPAPKVSSTGAIDSFTGRTALNAGPIPNKNVCYLPAKLHGAIQQDWQWGPSSEHANFTIIHGMADGAAHSITDDIDPTLYLQLITRAGKEKANLPQ